MAAFPLGLIGRSLSQCLKRIVHKPSLARLSSSVTYPLQLASVSENHAALYEESLKNPQRFWGDLARRRLLWMKEFDQVMDCDMQEGKISWFNGGKLNVTGEDKLCRGRVECVGVWVYVCHAKLMQSIVVCPHALRSYMYLIWKTFAAPHKCQFVFHTFT